VAVAYYNETVLVSSNSAAGTVLLTADLVLSSTVGEGDRQPQSRRGAPHAG